MEKPRVTGILKALLLGLALLAGASPTRAAEGSAPKETVGWRASLVPGSQGTVVQIEVLPGHYIYRERTEFTAEGATVDRVEWPSATRKLDPFEKRELEIYEEGPHLFALHLGPASGPITLDVKSQACTHEYCLFPHHQKLSLTASAGGVAPTPAASPAPGSTRGGLFTDQRRMAALIAEHFFLALAVAFLGGLLISGTPCVYPMIPITISVIGSMAGREGSQSRSRGFFLSLVYVAGITAVYASLGLFAALSHREFGFLLNSPWVLLAMAGIFAALAVSMFGAFSLQLPSSVQTRLLTYQGKGFAGVFVTGLFSGVVAGPCTAPVLLGILVAISGGTVGAAGGFLLMASFSLGMGVLFVVLGTFSGALVALPQSGPWMETVKHGFGVLLAAAALYYLRMALPGWPFDLALGASLVLAGYFLGVGKALAAEASALHRSGKAIGVLAVAAGLYFFVGGLSLSGVGPDWLPRPGTLAVAPGSPSSPIGWLTSEAAARARAAAEGRPMMIDFFADWCEDCKKLDATVYLDPAVVAEAKNFVPLKVDTTVRLGASSEEEARIEAVKQRYDLRGLPKVVFTTPDGTPIPSDEVTGLVSPASFLCHMKAAEGPGATC